MAVISDLMLEELALAPKMVREVFQGIPERSIEFVSLSYEAEKLAHSYVQEKVVTEKHIIDAQHIAIATIARVDLLVSWNFRQIVNVNRMHAFNAVNLKLGYSILEIRSPREVVNNEEEI